MDENKIYHLELDAPMLTCASVIDEIPRAAGIDPAVIRAAQRNIHQCKNGINKALRSAQGQPEYAFNDQHSRDGKVRIALRSAS